MILNILQIIIQLLVFFLDPTKRKRDALQEKKELNQTERSKYAKAIVSGDQLTIAVSLDRLLREARIANRARRKLSSKAPKV